jgi:hypothetical protein
VTAVDKHTAATIQILLIVVVVLAALGLAYTV